MNNHEDIQDLWERYLANQCTIDEVGKLIAFQQANKNSPLALEMIEKGLGGDLPERFLSQPQVNFILEDAFENIATRTISKPHGKLVWFRMAKYAAAAVLVLSIGWGAYSVLRNETSQPLALGEIEPIKLPEGINQVVLTLGNGKDVKMGEVSESLLQTAYHLPVRKQEGALIYGGVGANHSAELHTVATSKGAQYRIELADGSKVWLNAGSSLKYPTIFNGTDREVELTGEGYFEVAKNAQKPFYVKVNQMRIAVLGTVFNVNAYPNEKVVKTTLMEGSVKVSAGKDGEKELVIRPGEQAVYDLAEGLEKTEVNGADVMGWKQGVIRFSGNGIDIVLRQIARWYDVEIEYKHGIPNIEIAGEMPNHTSLENLVRVLNASGLDIRIDHKKLIVN